MCVVFSYSVMRMASLMKALLHLLVFTSCAVRSAPDPIGFWLLNDKYGAPFKDMTGRGNDAIPSNVDLEKAFPTSEYRSAHFEVPGNSTIDLGSKDGVFAVNSFTFAAGIKPDGNTIDFDGPILTWAPDGYYGTHVWQNMDGLLYVRIVSPDGSTINRQLLEGIQLGRWNKIAVAYNASSNFLKLFVNDDTLSAGPPGPVTATQHLTAGDLQLGYHGGVDYDTRQYRGFISCVTLFDQYVDLTSKDFTSIFDTCLGKLDAKRAPVSFCQISGDPHYHQFDGSKVHNQGTCKYIVSQDGCVEGKVTSAPTFQVIVKTWRPNANSKGSFVKEVLVKLPVYSMDIQMLQGRWSALVNGEPVPSFPATLNEYAKLTTSFARMYLTTSIGIEVLWDGKNFVKVVLEGQYAQRTCGVCGVYNKNSTDDYIMGPSADCLTDEGANRVGKTAFDDDMFVNSWLYKIDEDDVDCEAECKKPEPQPVCDDDDLPSARDKCAVFEQIKGPFRKCISNIIEEDGDDHVGVFQNCVYDQCLAGDNDTVCNHAAALADICANKYDTPVSYRRPHLCPLPCPRGSRKDPCGSICKQKTCSNLKPTCTEVDLTNCEDMCVCIDGYVLHNGTCLKESDCGCPYELYDTTIAVGDSIVNSDCSQVCTCDTAGGDLSCKNLTCPENTQCSVVEGVRGCNCLSPQKMVDGKCVGSQTCRCSGDPHCESFDGKANKFMGACKYVLAQDNCVDGFPEGTPNFIVAADYWRRNKTQKKFSWVKEVIVVIDNFRIELKQGGETLIDGKIQLLPVQLNTHIDVFDMPNYVFVTTAYGLKVMWDRKFSVRVTITPDLMETVCGICGDFDQDPSDDWVVGPAAEGDCFPDPPGTHVLGSLATDINTFGYSWTFEHDNDSNCKEFCKEPPVEEPICDPADKAAAESICSALKNATGPLKACLAVMTQAKIDFFYKSCMFDVCHVGGNTSFACTHSAELVSQCHTDFNITIGWRSQEYCPLPCGENQKFYKCMPTCTPSCTDLKAENCFETDLCEEGCVCDEGYVFATDKCVLPVDCGCKVPQVGVTIMPGETQLFNNCSFSCTCEEHGADPTCTNHTCRRDQVCEAASDTPVSECKCKPWSTEVNGSCIAHPVCSCSGDPHCKQFDKGHFSFQGSCTYVLAQDACEAGLPYSKPNWQVIINNVRPKPKKRATKVEEVYVLLPKLGYRIDLLQAGVVHVNGKIVTLPKSLGDDGIVTVFNKPNYVYVSAPALGLMVMWDRVYSVRVNVIPELEGHTCGLCGVYNRNNTDDRVVGPARDCMKQFDDPKIGKPAWDDEIFGASWFYGKDDEDPFCAKDCADETTTPDKCDKETKSKAEAVCAVLADMNGPLKDCLKRLGWQDFTRIRDDCKFDICELNDTSLVCQHATNLVEDCVGKHGAVGNISQWRSPDFCPMECVANTTYSVCGPSCKPSCEDIHGLRCRDAPDECVEGCFCDAPLLWNGEKCVEKDVCERPCSICDFLINPNTQSTYDTWVECFTCQSASIDDCYDDGAFSACVEPHAICSITTERVNGTVVAVQQGCQSKATCPQGSMGVSGACSTTGSKEICTRCTYGDTIPNNSPKPIFRCGS